MPGTLVYQIFGPFQVAPHGLIGQTFDGDGVAVDGALDDYSANVVYTKALGEGAIEGQAADYELPPNAPFSSVFKYCPPNRCCFCAVHTHPCNTPCDMQAAFFTRSPVYSFLHEQLVQQGNTA